MSVSLPLDTCPLRYQAIKDPTHSAFLWDGHALSYALIDHWVNDICLAMAKQGIQTNDRLMLLNGNALDTCLLIIACLRTDVLFCPVNPSFPEDQITQYALNASINWLCSPATLSERLLQYCNHFVLPEKNHNVQRPNTLIKINPNALLTVVATSGSTGTPKAIAHSYKNHFFNAVGSQSALPLKPEDSWLVSLPLFHVGGIAIIFRCLLAGATLIAFSKHQPLAETLTSYRISHLSLVNTQLYRLLIHEKMHLGNTGLRYILLGGGIASQPLVETAQNQGLVVLTTYGMTEMGSQVCTDKPVFSQYGMTSGSLLPYCDIKIADHDEIYVRGKPLAQGILHKGELQTVTDASGWYHTGDRGKWLNNQILVTGRTDNLFISGGENIQPEEIERALLLFPTVIQAVVVPYLNVEFGQRPVAYLKTTDSLINVDALKQHLSHHIARFKVPDKFLPFPDTSQSLGIKVNRQKFKFLAQQINR
ncbi:2-succinylbenzoate--CoA ligase [invertebrate metagenome]|uniref:2-succinylbenzoate--CoA ligase n=1 Tax=invertebrate metagenome TaxID=1711999 RepID=A0A2H9TAL9_9ZZZZ